MASERKELELLRQQQSHTDDRAELEFLRNQQDNPAQQEPSNFAPAFTQSTSRSFIDNMLNLPNAVGELAGQGLAGATAAVRTPFSQNTFGENLELAQNTPPASTLIGGMNVPDSFDLQAGISTIPDVLAPLGMSQPGRGAISMTAGDRLIAEQMRELQTQSVLGVPERFNENRAEALTSAIDLREDQPFASGAGEVTGDVASILTGRLPIAKSVRNTRITSGPRPAKTPIPPSLRQTIDDVINSKVVQSMKRGGIHVAETGLEGALIAAMNDEDPLNSAALSAGSQAMGSLALTGSRGLLGNKGANFVVAAATTMGFIQLFKESTPGGRDRILESAESSYEKIAALMALGGLATVAGMGRSGHRISNQIPLFADSVTSIPRGAMVSILSDFADDSEGRIEPILTKVIQEPDFFGPEAQRRLERAILNEDVSLKNTIESLMVDRGFRRKLNTLRGTQ